MWILSKSSPVPVKVSAFDTELEFNISHNATGKLLFEQVAKTIGLREVMYFGLEYCDVKGFYAWLDNNEKVMSQDCSKVLPKYDTENRLHFHLRVKFYPEDVTQEVVQDFTLVSFCIFFSIV